MDLVSAAMAAELSRLLINTHDWPAASASGVWSKEAKALYKSD